MKIAIVTDNGRTVSAHFGRAPYYALLTVENGQIVHRELRNKLGHHHGQFHAGGEHHPGPEHGRDPASHARHAEMATGIQDADVLLSGGMGRGAYDSLHVLGVRVVMTDVQDVDAAALAYAQGTLLNKPELLH